MRKYYTNKTNLNSDIDINKNIENNNTKTTNVNILLNRVRLDKQKTLKKRIIFVFLLVSLISTLIAYFSI